MKNAILVGNCPSSGSTLLSLMLDAHPEILCGPELNIFSHPIFWQTDSESWSATLKEYISTPVTLRFRDQLVAQGFSPYTGIPNKSLQWYDWDVQGLCKLLDKKHDPIKFCKSFFAKALRREKKKKWAEKSPPNIFAISTFAQKHPDGKAIVIVRNPIDVIASLKRRNFSFGRALTIWLVETAMAYEVSKLDNVHLMRYEDLAVHPENTLRSMQEFLCVSDHTERLVNYQDYSGRVQTDNTLSIQCWKNSPTQGISTSSVGSGETELSSAEIWLLNTLVLSPAPAPPGYASLSACEGMRAADLAKQLGYDALPSCDINTFDHSELIAAIVDSYPSLLEVFNTKGDFWWQNLSFDNEELDFKLPMNSVVEFVGKSSAHLSQQIKLLQESLAKQSIRLSRQATIIESHRKLLEQL